MENDKTKPTTAAADESEPATDQEIPAQGPPLGQEVVQPAARPPRVRHLPKPLPPPKN